MIQHSLGFYAHPQSGTVTGYGWGIGKTIGCGLGGSGQGFTTGTFGVGGSRAKMMFGMVTDWAGRGTGTLMGNGCGTGAKEIGGVIGAGAGYPHPP